MISRKMFCSARTGRALGLTFLILATVACGLSFVSPYWTSIRCILTARQWGDWSQEFNFMDIIGCQWYDKFTWGMKRDDLQYGCISVFCIFCFILAVPIACCYSCCCHSKCAAYFTGVAAILASVFLGVLGYDLYMLYSTPYPYGKFNWA